MTSTTSPISFRLPADVHEALKKAAADDARSLNGEAVTALREWLEARGHLPKRKKGKP